MRLIRSRPLQNENTPALLGIQGELRNMIYELLPPTVTPTVTLIRKKPHYQSSKMPRKEWKHCFQIVGPSLTRVCRQIRYETISYKPTTLVLPFDVDLGVLLRLKAFSYFSKVRTIKITDKLAKRFRGLYGGNYRGVKVDMWKREKLVRQTFPSVKCVMVKKVWRNLEEKTICSLITLFGKLPLEIRFNWDQS